MSLTHEYRAVETERGWEVHYLFHGKFVRAEATGLREDLAVRMARDLHMENGD